MSEGPSGLRHFLSELRRRRVYRVAVVYAVVVVGGDQYLPKRDHTVLAGQISVQYVLSAHRDAVAPWCTLVLP